MSSDGLDTLGSWAGILSRPSMGAKDRGRGSTLIGYFTVGHAYRISTEDKVFILR